MTFDGTVQAAHAKKTGITTPVFFSVRRDHQLVVTLPAELKSLAGLYPESCRFLICAL